MAFGGSPTGLVHQRDTCMREGAGQEEEEVVASRTGQHEGAQEPRKVVSETLRCASRVSKGTNTREGGAGA